MKQTFIILLITLLIISTGYSSKTSQNKRNMNETNTNVEGQEEQTTTSRNNTSQTEYIPSLTERLTIKSQVPK